MARWLYSFKIRTQSDCFESLQGFIYSHSRFYSRSCFSSKTSSPLCRHKSD